MNCQRLTYTCLELLAILVSTLAAPLVTTSLSLDNPCGLAPGAALELPPNMVDFLKATITDANAASAANQAVVNKLRSDVMLTENELITYTNKTLPSLPLRLPEVNVSKSNMDAITRQQYNDTSIAIIYLDSAIKDDTQYDNKRYQTELQSAQNSLYSLMCKIFYMMKSSNISIPLPVNASVIPSTLQQLSDAKRRYYRNVMITSQVARNMTKTQASNYEKFIEVVSTSG
uniref:Uncharacterized protein n=1 Tax=Biomphalaria glabrata TaxID=6526 RepID=A0A2C9L1U6_BIOGL